MILHEGINEAGSVASFTAVGTSYATHGEPMIPIYIFYSMFGFQRTGDGFWAAADQMARGFVLGATAGRTTLNGEGLQHEDGHSLLLASTNPAVVAYDPAFGFEVGHIVADGLRRMYGEDPENVFYYLTIYNEPFVQPAEPEDVDVEGILRGHAPVAPAADATRTARGRRSSRPASRCRGRCARRSCSRDDWGVHADVWSVTSWNELRRDGLEVDRAQLPAPGRGAARTAYVTRRLEGRPGPVVAVSDFMRAVQDQIAPWVPRRLRLAGHRRVRAVRHPRCAAPALPGRRRVDHGAGAGAAGPARRGRRRRAAPGDRELPARRRHAPPTPARHGRRLTKRTLPQEGLRGRARSASRPSW